MNAKIALGSSTVTGDVEIHNNATDWVMHGHHLDTRYDNVILHVVANDNSVEASADIRARLPGVPVMLLQHAPGGSRPPAKADMFPKGRCEAIFAKLSNDKLLKLFRHAGMKRFELKTEAILEEMRSEGVDSAFLKSLFDACGYRQNRKQFLELFERFSHHDCRDPEDCETVLWGESGLLPDPATTTLDPPMAKFVSELWAKWWKIRTTARPPIPWSKSSVRPVNSPERRLAALAMLLKNLQPSPMMAFANLAKQIPEEKLFIKRLSKMLQCSHPLWDRHYSFTVKAPRPSRVLAQSRMSDITLNTVLPALKAYSIMTEDNKTGKFISRVASSLPKGQPNMIIRNASFKWFSPPSRQHDILADAISQQGAIHVYRNFCEETCSECSVCPLGELLEAK